MADRQLNVIVRAITDELRSGMADMQRAVSQATRAAQADFERTRQTIDRATSGIGDRINREFTLIRPAAFVTGLNQGIELIERAARALQGAWAQTIGSVISTGDELVTLSRRFSIPIEQLDEFRFIAGRAGVDVGDLGLAFRKLASSLVDGTQAGTEANRRLVGQLGFTIASLKELQKASPVEQLFAIGQALDRFADSAQKTDAANELLGRGLQTVFQLLRENPGRVDELKRKFEELGGAMDPKAAEASERFGDAQVDLATAIQKLKERLFGSPELINGFGQRIDSLATRIAEFGKSIPADDIDKLQGGIIALADATAEFGGALARLATGTPDAETFVRELAGELNLMADALDRLRTDPGAAFRDMVSEATRALPVLNEFRGAVEKFTALPERRILMASETTTPTTTGLRNPPRPPGAPSPITEAPEFPISGIGETLASGVIVPSTGVVPPPPKPQLPGLGAKPEEISRARAAAFAELQRAQDQELAAESKNAEARLQIVSRYSVLIGEKFGLESVEFDKQKTKQAQAEEAAQQQRLAIAQQGIEAKKADALASVEIETQRIETERQAGLISNQEAIDRLRAFAAERIRILRQSLEEEKAALQAAGAGPVELGRVEAGLRALGTEEQKVTARLDDQEFLAAAERIRTVVGGVFDAIGQAFDRSVQGMIQGTLTLQEAWANAWQSILAQGASALVQLVAKEATTQAARLAMHLLLDRQEATSHVAKETTKTGATVAGETARTAAVIAGAEIKGATEAAETKKSIVRAAADAAAKAYSALAGIYAIGPILGAAAAAATFAAVLAFGTFITAKEGAERIPKDGTTLIAHEGETVLPAETAVPMRDLARSLGVSVLDRRFPALLAARMVGGGGPRAAVLPTASVGGPVLPLSLATSDTSTAVTAASTTTTSTMTAGAPGTAGAAGGPGAVAEAGGVTVTPSPAATTPLEGGSTRSEGGFIPSAGGLIPSGGGLTPSEGVTVTPSPAPALSAAPGRDGAPASASATATAVPAVAAPGVPGAPASAAVSALGGAPGAPGMATATGAPGAPASAAAAAPPSDVVVIALPPDVKAPGTAGGAAVISAAQGAVVPREGAIGVLHPGETVTPGGLTPVVPTETAFNPGTGKATETPAPEAGAPAASPPGVQAGNQPAVTAAVAAGAAVTAANMAVTGFSGGPGGGGKTQPVSIVSAPATLQTRSRGGEVTATIGAPVQTTPAGGVTPVAEQQEVKQVNVINKVPVSFSAIQTMFALSTDVKPFGIGVGISVGFGTITAFKGGGDVPENMLAFLHQDEKVLPAPQARGLTNVINLFEAVNVVDVLQGTARVAAGDGALRGTSTISIAPISPPPTVTASLDVPAPLGASGETVHVDRLRDAAQTVEEHHHHYDVKAIDTRDFRDRLEAESDVLFAATEKRVKQLQRPRRGR